MNEADVAPKRRRVTSVDLGEFRPHVEQACAMAGVGPSTWLRALVARDLAKRAEPSLDGPARSLDIAADRPLVYRAWLDAGLTAKLDERRRRDGFRSRAAVLRALIHGVGMTQANGVGSDALLMSNGGRDVSLRELVDVLGASNYELVAISRSLNQIVKMLRVATGQTVMTDRVLLEAAAASIRQHVDQASKLVGQLRPMLSRAG